MTDLKPYYQVKLTLLRCKSYFLNNSPKTEDEKYAYDTIEKAYLINEKKIEMLDFEKNKQLLKNITTATIKAKIKRRHYYERIKI